MYSTTSSGMPRSARMCDADLLERGQLHREAEHALGQVLRRALVDPHHGLGRVAGLGERVQHLADALALGVDDVERLAVEARPCGRCGRRRRRRSRPGRCSSSPTRG